MNKLFMLIAGILLMGVVISGGSGAVSMLTAKNIDIEYPAEKSPEVKLIKEDMQQFNDITYEVSGNTIILNKPGIFQNREIAFEDVQPCLEEKDKECPKTTRDELIQARIKQEIEFVKGVQDERFNRIKVDSDIAGKVLIK